MRKEQFALGNKILTWSLVMAVESGPRVVQSVISLKNVEMEHYAKATLKSKLVTVLVEQSGTTKAASTKMIVLKVN